MSRLRQFWADVRTGLWFVPALMTAFALALAYALVEIDGRLNRELLFEYPRIFGAGADGSRGMLTAIASSMITVAGLTFSLTLAALAQASSQYTSRVLRNFMRDRANQFVLGYFVAVFAYCLVVLRTIRGGDEGRFIPSLAVLVGLLLAILSIGVLIFFVHHIASSIQATAIIASAAAETTRAVERLFPDELGDAAEEAEEDRLDDKLARQKWRAIQARRTGYVQDADADGLLRFAQEHDVTLRMERAVGEFVIEEAPLVSYAGDRALDAEAANELAGLFDTGRFRTIDRDAAFGFRQIVDIALKALSPGVNDPTTAAVCIDHLSALLARLAGQRIARPLRADGGRVLVITRGADFGSLADAAFDEIRDAANGNTIIYLRLLDAIRAVARQTRSAHRRAILLRHVELVGEEAERAVAAEHNRRRVRERIGEARAALAVERPAAAIGDFVTNDSAAFDSATDEAATGDYAARIPVAGRE